MGVSSAIAVAMRLAVSSRISVRASMGRLFMFVLVMWYCGGL